MPHNIGEMFYVGERPWHELGRALPQPANMDEALMAGGLNWKVGMVSIAPVDDPKNVIGQRQAIVRLDRALGDPRRVIGVVHPGFVPLQNAEGAKLFDSLLGRGERVYHTGGYLKNGEKVWLLARLPAEIKLNGHDVIEPYLLFSNSHDGSSGIDIRLTTIRVVCQNTLSMALGQKAEGKVFRRGHDGRYETVADEAHAFFRFALQQTREAEQLFSRLAAKPCDDQAFELFLKALMPDIKKPASAERDMRVKRTYETKQANLLQAREQIRQVRQAGIPEYEIPPDAPTWWGTLNTVTAWADHLQDTQSDRYAHNLVGSGDKLKSNALRLAKAAIS